MATDPLRVMFLLNSFEVGGTEMNAVRTAEALDPRRVQISVAAFRPFGPLLHRYERLGIEVQPISIPNLYGMQTLSELRRFARLLRRERIEILHTHDVYANIFGAPAGRLAGVRGIIASRRWWKRVPTPGLLIPNRAAYGLAHRVLVNASAVGEMLRNDERVPGDKILLLRNFIEDEAFATVSAEERARWRVRLGLPADALLAGAVGRLALVKDNATLIRALGLVDAATGLRVVLVGDGPDRQALEALASEIGVGERVHFLGELPNRPNLHQLFDISVLCSVSEGFPNSLLEAMAAARCVVTTPVGGVPEAVIPNRNGLFFPPGDATALAAQLSLLATTPTMRSKLGAAGSALARSTYSSTAVLGALMSTYEELAGRTVA